MIRVVMDSQLRSALEKCPEYMNLRFNHNLVPLKGNNQGLEKGTMMHRMLENYYIARRDAKPLGEQISIALETGNLYIKGCSLCVAKICQVHKDPYLGLESITIEDAQWVLETMVQYHERWKNDFWTPVEIEYVKGEVIYEDDNISLMWKAKIDTLMDTMEAVVSMDHKTESRAFPIIDLNNQFMGQAILTNQNKMVVNRIGFQTTSKPEEKFKREVKSYSDARKAEWIAESARYAYEYIDIVKNESYYHRWHSCKGTFGPCIFHNVCSGEPNDRARLLMENFKPADRIWDINNE